MVASAHGRTTVATVDLEAGQSSVEFRYLGLEECGVPSIFWTGPDTEDVRSDFLDQMSSSTTASAARQDIELERIPDGADTEALPADVEVSVSLADEEVLRDVDNLVFYKQAAEFLRSDGVGANNSEVITLGSDWTELGNVEINVDHAHDPGEMAAEFDVFHSMTESSQSHIHFGHGSNGELSAMNEQTDDVSIVVNALPGEEPQVLQSGDHGVASDDFIM